MAHERSSGVVQWFSAVKGYGFIKPDDDGEDLFVHQSSIKSDGYRTLNPGDVVEFSILLDEEKTKAVNVTGPNGSSIGTRGGRGFVNDRRSGGEYGVTSPGCYNCGDPGHFARDCNRSHGGGGGGTNGCYNCGEVGHLARDCRRMNYGGNGGGNGGGCYRCGDFGHLARECLVSWQRNGGGANCFNCGEVGHLARDCSPGGGRLRNGGGGAGGFVGSGGRNCFNCGRQGHFARECPTTSW